MMLLLSSIPPLNAQPIVIGSKKFTESNVLGEIARKVIADAGFEVEHKQGMGGTIILWNALKSGEISAYPDYTGTIINEILKVKGQRTLDEIREGLKPFGVGVADELGFNNTYALCLKRTKAKELNIHTISDLKNHPELRVAVTHEFLNRNDGWKPLMRHYGIEMPNVRGIEHSLAYRAIQNNVIDLTDAYSTDAEIAEYDLSVLEDDQHFFPQYKAVFLYRLEMPAKALEALQHMAGTLPEKRMVVLNLAAKRTKSYTKAAALYFTQTPSAAQASTTVRPPVMEEESTTSKVFRNTLQHLRLVAISMLYAILIGIPLGIIASRPGFVSQIILGFTGMIQTVPSLALLALFVPFLGITPTTAILALFLYSLLPIVRNTATGLQEIPLPLRESAAALGLEPAARLRKVFLPMASRTILAGIKTSTIINVGTATLAALIGQGGLGEPIISGLDLNDSAIILQGAIPAALLALLVQIAFDLLDRLLIPKGLRWQGSKTGY